MSKIVEEIEVSEELMLLKQELIEAAKKKELNPVNLMIGLNFVDAMYHAVDDGMAKEKLKEMKLLLELFIIL